MVSATGQGPINIRFAIMLCHCIIPGGGAASVGEIVLEQRLDQSRNRLRKAGLARNTNAQRQLIRDQSNPPCEITGASASRGLLGVAEAEH